MPSTTSPLVDSAPGFPSILSGYTVFIGPITGIMMTDVRQLFLSVAGTL